MDRLRIAIIGQGRSGRGIHGEFFLSDLNDTCTVSVVCDQLEARRERAAKEYGCKVVSDYHELIAMKEQIDLVVNASFSYQHYSITKELLENGMNVIVEKPFAATEAECRDLIETAKKNNAHLFVFQQSLFNPAFTNIVDIIKAGKLGKVVSVDLKYSGFSHRYDWQTLQCFLGGALYNTGPHPIGQALELLGWDENTKLSYSSLENINSSGDAEDTAKLILTAPSGAKAEVEISACDLYSPYIFKVQGSNGTLVSTNEKYELTYIKDGEFTVHEPIKEPLSNEAGDPVYCSENLVKYHESGDIKGNSFDVAVQDFYRMAYEAIRNGKAPEIAPEKGLMVIKVIEQCHKDNPLEKKFSL